MVSRDIPQCFISPRPRDACVVMSFSQRRIGPIVRITPTEVHISDPEYFDTLYSRGNGRRDKYAYFSGSFGFTSDSFNTVDHNLHRLRRKAIAPFFSAARISDFQPVIHAKVDKLCDILHTYVGNDVVVSLDRAWIALTTDIITEYSFAKSFDNLDSPGFKDTMHEALIAVYTITKFAMQFPFVIPILDALPQWLIRMVKPEIMPVVGLKRDLAAEIRNIRNDVNQGHKTAIHPTIFHEVLLNDDLPAEEKTDARLGDEAQLIVAAGLVTTSWALTIASFYLSRDPHITLQLREELSSSNLSTPYDWNQLQKLPYLNGVVHEAIRLSHGTATRHPRLAPDAELVYGRWKIPRNTPVSMTTMDIMMNETVFPEPGNFLPERWVRDGTALEKYFVPFGKGSRQCLGIK